MTIEKRGRINSSMSKKTSKTIMLAQKLKALKKGCSFDVKSESERQLAMQAASTLRAAGAIDLWIYSRKNGNDGFTIYAA